MKRLLTPACLAAALATAASAQNPAFVPAGLGARDGNSSVGTNWRSSRRYQCIYAPSLLAGAPRQITAVAFRADGTTTQPAFAANVTMLLSSAGVPLPAASDGQSFAANFGTDLTTVLNNAPVTMPASTAGTGPSTAIVVVPLAVPFTPVAGAPLLVDVTFHFATAPAAPGGWILDAQTFPSGYWQLATAVAGRACPSPGTWDVFADSINDGVQWRYSSSAPAGLPAVFATGLSDTNFAGAALPLALDPLGATGCALHTSIDATQVTSTLQSGFGSAAFGTAAVPRDPRLLGARVFAQLFVLDRAVNAAGLRASEKSTVSLSGPPDPRLSVLLHSNTAPNVLRNDVEVRVFNQALVLGLQ